eukprot:TRINITY_DN5794_c0_g1_i4.p2 TRINITY_DN5794_c0_g1~~TRINITY_DN5794_c0_g1_i4.p2  ORF type:complete len:148 (-),score=0.87 TRINITY_DN5794_c0_g1_i4:399-842(-)
MPQMAESDVCVTTPCGHNAPCTSSLNSITYYWERQCRSTWHDIGQFCEGTCADDQQACGWKYDTSNDHWINAYNTKCCPSDMMCSLESQPRGWGYGCHYKNQPQGCSPELDTCKNGSVCSGDRGWNYKCTCSEGVSGGQCEVALVNA